MEKFESVTEKVISFVCAALAVGFVIGGLWYLMA